MSFALAAPEHISERYDNGRRFARAALNEATTQYLLQNKSPSRRVNELDNRGSHYYLATYWARALATQTADTELAARFGPIAEQLAGHEEKIVGELNDVQGAGQDIGGYYAPNPSLAAKAMRPSDTLNTIIDGI